MSFAFWFFFLVSLNSGSFFLSLLWVIPFICSLGFWSRTLLLQIFWLNWLFFVCFQVHITQGDHEGKAVIVSWVTVDEPGSNIVQYWAENSNHKNKAKGILTKYKFYNYTSGYIHHCTIRNLEVDFQLFLFCPLA